MKSLYIIILFQLFVTYSALAQNKEITVELKVDGKEVNIADDFEINFIIEDSLVKKIIKPKVKGNSFIIPDFKEGSRGAIVFKCGKYELAFGDAFIAWDQKMRWTFGLDKKPFDPDNYAGTLEEKMDSYQLLNYLKFNPHEYGESTVVTNFIHDLKEYKKGIKKLIN